MSRELYKRLTNFDRVGTQQFCPHETKNLEEVQTAKNTITYTGNDTDVFQLGVVLFALLFGSYPFERDKNDYYKYIETENWKQFWKTHDPLLRKRGIDDQHELVLCLTMMLQHTPENRPELMDLDSYDCLKVGN